VADCDFKKFFILSDCQYFLDISFLIFCGHPPFHVSFLVLISVVSVSPFKSCSVSAFSEFLFFRYSLSAPTSSSYLHLTIQRRVLLFCPWFSSLLCLLLYFSCLVYMFIEWRKKALLSFEWLLVSYCNVGGVRQPSICLFQIVYEKYFMIEREKLYKFFH